MLNKNFHHIVLLPLSAFVVSFLASLFIIPINRYECPVCYKEFCHLQRLPCGHEFYSMCIGHWIHECQNGVRYTLDNANRDNTVEWHGNPKMPECPMCRQKFDPEKDLH